MADFDYKSKLSASKTSPGGLIRQSQQLSHKPGLCTYKSREITEAARPASCTKGAHTLLREADMASGPSKQKPKVDS